MLEDGTYDAFVVDARPAEPATADAAPGLHLELTVLTGAHKGDVVAMRAEHLGMDEIDVLGMPATLTVRDGVPTVTVDR